MDAKKELEKASQALQGAYDVLNIVSGQTKTAYESLSIINANIYELYDNLGQVNGIISDALASSKAQDKNEHILTHEEALECVRNNSLIKLTLHFRAKIPNLSVKEAKEMAQKYIDFWK